MARATKKGGDGGSNPEAEERKRLKQLAFADNLLSMTPAKSFKPLRPSKTVLRHHGKDILKKSQRKNRYLFSFPGLLAPISGGKIGELSNLGTKNPTLYLDFSQGRMKLSGTIVYPKNRYLTLQFSKGGKNVMCGDYFDTMIVFSEACWVGEADKNAEETRLDIPLELPEHCEYAFHGGAGVTDGGGQAFDSKDCAYRESPIIDAEADMPDRKDNLKHKVDVMPVRHSERTAGKSFNWMITHKSITSQLMLKVFLSMIRLKVAVRCPEKRKLKTFLADFHQRVVKGSQGVDHSDARSYGSSCLSTGR